MCWYQIIPLLLAIGTSLFLLVQRGDMAVVTIMVAVLAILLFFSAAWRVMRFKNHSMASEIRDRTVTWWWMVAVFMLALSTHKIVSFFLLGFLCFSSLREYYSMLPMHEYHAERLLSFKDRLPVFFSYASIPVIIYVAYIEWYNLFLILIPVYVFLFIPILLILQNRTTGAIRSLGVITLGFMFFVHNLGHCLFMINMGSLVLLFCFTLTEVRDLLSFWIGKWQAKMAAGLSEGRVKRMLALRIAPEVSPKKTWAAGLVSAACMALISLLFVPLMPEFPQGRMSSAYSALIGFMIGVLGLFGDLAFSMIKRDVGVKDSGSILPGHGGIIDRVDSLIFTIPVTFHLIRWAYF